MVLKDFYTIELLLKSGEKNLNNLKNKNKKEKKQ